MSLGHAANLENKRPNNRDASASMTDIACRLIWAILAGIHLVPLLLVTGRLIGDPDLAKLGSLIALAGVTTFFLAKAVDLEPLRSDRPRLELAIWFLAAALVHPAPSDFGQADPVLLTAGATAAVLLVGIRQGRRGTGWKPFAPKSRLTSRRDSSERPFIEALRCFIWARRGFADVLVRWVAQALVRRRLAANPPPHSA